MTGRTHDLAAFTALTLYLSYQPIPQMSLATALAAVGANMIGGLLPDIDDKNADIWDKIRGGSLFSRIIKPLIGGHRMISHSILGILLFGLITDLLFKWASMFILVDMTIVWWSLMIGYISHLVTDSLTVEGVPWLFPLPIRFGFPPLKKLRIKTGGILETALIYPGLVILNGYLIYLHYPKFLALLKSLISYS